MKKLVNVPEVEHSHWEVILQYTLAYTAFHDLRRNEWKALLLFNFLVNITCGELHIL